MRWITAVLLVAAGGASVAVAQSDWAEGVADGLVRRPVRASLASVPLARPKTVSRVEMMRVDFPPRQVQQRHVHTVPLVCFIAIGRIAVKLQGQPEIVYDEGGVNVEPAGAVVERVANVTDRPARRYCAFLAGREDRVLSRYLTER